MKLRSVLFSSCTLLFASLSLKPQQKPETRLRRTAAVPVGFYTEVMGLGASPDATRIAGNVHGNG